MPSRSIAENEVWLNAEKYRIKGPVRRFTASLQPGKVTTGDFGNESNPFASTIELGDFRGGIGINRADLRKDFGRCWWSTCQLRYKRQTVLPGRPVTTAAGPAQDVQVLIDFLNEKYACWGTEVYKYNNSTDSWGSNLRTLLAVATDAIAGFVGATNTLVIATTRCRISLTSVAPWRRSRRTLPLIRPGSPTTTLHSPLLPTPLAITRKFRDCPLLRSALRHDTIVLAVAVRLQEPKPERRRNGMYRTES